MQAFDSALQVADRASGNVDLPLLGQKVKFGWSGPFMLLLALTILLGIILALLSGVTFLGRVFFVLFMVSAWGLCLCIHEAGHALFAQWAGEEEMEPYYTMNFLKYKDQIVTLAIPTGLMLILGAGIPGGIHYISKSTVENEDLKKRCLVAAGGIITNIILLYTFSIPIWIFSFSGSYLLIAIGLLNYLLAFSIVVNLIPIPPMDMFAVVFPMLPENIRQFCQTYLEHRYYSLGFLAILILVIWILSPLVWFLVDVVLHLALQNTTVAVIGLSLLPSISILQL